MSESTGRICDRILVVDGGRIVEQGTHRQLLELRGVYHGMWMLQQEEREHLPGGTG